MAIAIEAFTVVIKNESIHHRYPGGMEAFQMGAPNSTLCSDDSLSCISFMVENDAATFVQELQSLGLNATAGEDVVLCNGFNQEMKPECAWLQIGKYRQSTIAWMDGEDIKAIVGPPGWDPDSQRLEYATTQEAAKRLKYLRSDGNVQVFWDILAEREVYIGRTQAPLELLFQQAAAIVMANLRNPGAPPCASDARVDLQRAVEMLETVTERSPLSWRGHWMLGKAWHALGKSEQAYQSLATAFEIEKEETSIPRELSGICLELGRGNEAIRISEHAIGQEPKNSELLGNLAVAYLIDGRLKEAQTTIEAALGQNQEDSVNQTLKRIISSVSQGTRAQPHNLFDLTGARRT